MTLWKEHFSEVLNRPDPAEGAGDELEEENIGEGQMINARTDALDREEIIQGIKALKNNKEAGIDHIKGEMLTESQEVAVKVLEKV